MPATQAGPVLVAVVVGTISALLGILYATTDNDLKTMLAHSSIENVGIVVAGFGSGMVFVATNHPALAAIAFVAGLYHLINHSLYKTLLFFGVGAVETQTGTCDMDWLGGLIKWMPLTALGFLAGTLSIAALPLFNDFVSEWRTLKPCSARRNLFDLYENRFCPVRRGTRPYGGAGGHLLCEGVCDELFGNAPFGPKSTSDRNQIHCAGADGHSCRVVSGIRRAADLRNSGIEFGAKSIARRERRRRTGAAFLRLKPCAQHFAACVRGEFHDLGAQVGQSFLPGRGLVVMHRGGKENPVVFAMSTSYMLVALIVLLVLTYLIVRLWLTHRQQLARRPRWDGGVRRLLPEMTYTATGFSNPVRVIFDAVFQPTTVEDTRETVAEHFRIAIRREKESVHLVEKLVFQPTKLAAFWCAGVLAAMHHGRFNAYAAYALSSLLIVLVVFLLFQMS